MYIFSNIHISEAEYRCPCCGKLPPDLHVHPVYFEFFQIWEDLREAWKRPVKIPKGGGWRCPRYQYSLILADKTKATCSPHFFFALDNDFSSRAECVDYLTLIEKRHPELRVGFQAYLEAGKSFVHIDCCYLVEPRPSLTWIRGYRW